MTLQSSEFLACPRTWDVATGGTAAENFVTCGVKSSPAWSQRVSRAGEKTTELPLRPPMDLSRGTIFSCEALAEDLPDWSIDLSQPAHLKGDIFASIPGAVGERCPSAIPSSTLASVRHYTLLHSLCSAGRYFAKSWPFPIDILLPSLEFSPLFA